jgi:hypothetical protein
MNEMTWNDMKWNRMEWNGMEWMNEWINERMKKWKKESRNVCNLFGRWQKLWSQNLQAKTHRECAQHFLRRRSAQILCEIELSLQSRAPFVDHFPRSRRETAETETILRRPRTATLPEKTQGFAPARVFTHEFTRSRALTLPNYLHNDVVALMIEVMMLFPSCWES